MRPCVVVGITLDNEYSQSVDCGFHISMAALEPQQNKGEIIQICFEQQQSKYIFVYGIKSDTSQSTGYTKYGPLAQHAL